MVRRSANPFQSPNTGHLKRGKIHLDERWSGVKKVNQFEPKRILVPGVGSRAPNKFNAKKVWIDKIRFDSKAEGDRYLLLKARQTKGEISNLTVHPTYPLVINGVKIGKFTPDFRYNEAGVVKFEDVKNPVSKSLASLRIKVFEALYKTQVECVMNNPRWAARKQKKRGLQDGQSVVSDTGADRRTDSNDLGGREPGQDS